MPLYALLEIAIQVALVVHIIRTGRSFIWVWLVIFVPLIGALAYFIVELLPGLTGSPRLRSLRRGAAKRLDPSRDLRRRKEALEGADTIDNRRLLAEAYLELGRHDEAWELYRSSLAGVHADDPSLLMGAARAAFGRGHPEDALACLDRLRAANPNFQSHDGHLLYAKALDALGRDNAALDEYEALVAYAPGEEARCRYAMLLQRRGETAAANALFAEILDRARRGTNRYRAAEREWIELARRHGGSPDAYA